MLPRRLVPFLLASLVLLPLAAPALAQADDTFAPPAGAERDTSENLEIAHWIGTETTVATEPLARGEEARLWIAISRAALFPAADDTTGDASAGNGTSEPGPDNGTADGTTNSTADGNATGDAPATGSTNETAEPDANATQPARATITINVTSQDLAFPNATLQLETTEDEEGDWVIGSLPFTPTDNTPAAATYGLTYLIITTQADGTTTTPLAGSVTGTATVSPLPTPTPPEGIPTTYYIVGGAAAVAIAIGGALAMRNKRERERMNRAPRRSQALREEALERAATTSKRPEEKAAVVAEIRQQEKVRERRRELQILDAKKADALKSLELLRKRHEAGGLSKHQYDTMVAKKQADLTRIEAEIAEMEAQDNGGSAAA